jgi:hypothetical protein
MIHTVFRLGSEEVGREDLLIPLSKGSGVTLGGEHRGRQYRVVDVWLDLDISDPRNEKALFIDLEERS